MFLIVILGLFAMGEFLFNLAHGQLPTTLGGFETAATAMLAIYCGYQQMRGNRHAASGQEKQQFIEQLLQKVGTDVLEGSDKVSHLSLDPGVRDDHSEAGVAWKRIHGKFTYQHYTQHQADFPDSPYHGEAARRIESIAQWQRVDEADPFDIHFFLRTSPFEALRRHAEGALKQAVKKRQAGAREEFWRQVGIPFHVLLPLAPFVYVFIFGALMSFYFLAGHTIFAPHLQQAADFVRATSTKLNAWPYYHHVQPAAEWAVLHIDRIARISLAVILGIVALYLLLFVITAIVKVWIEPRVSTIQKRLDQEVADTYEALL